MIYLWILIIVGLILLIYMFLKAHLDHIEITEIEDVNFPSNEEKLSIFFISDVHKRLIKDKTINEIPEPNIIIIGGDLCEKGVPLSNVRENIQKLKSLKAPIFFVWGNNDYEVNFRELDALLLENGVNVLADSSIQFELKNGRTFSLIGLDSITYKKVNPNIAFENLNSDYSILAIHDPKQFDLLSKQQKSQVNLVVSGHTHGGQIRLLNWGLYPRGGWREAPPYFLVSEGYGTTKLPLRLGTRAECHVIIIRSN